MSERYKSLSILIYEIFIGKVRYIASSLFIISLLLFLVEYFLKIDGLKEYSLYIFISGLIMLGIFPLFAIMILLMSKIIKMVKDDKK